MGLIKQFWLESGCVYGYRKVHSDLRDLGESCGINRVYRLMRSAGLKALVGYRKPRYRKGDSHVITPNRLQTKNGWDVSSLLVAIHVPSGSR